MKITVAPVAGINIFNCFQQLSTMDSISSRVDKVAPSLTLSVTNQAKAMQARGEEVYGLAGGEPDQDTPDFIKQAAVEALSQGKTKYTPAAGIPELRESIANKLKEDNGIEYDPRQVVVNSGAKQSCFNAILAICEEGDEVIIPSPYWVSYPEMVRLAGAEPVFVETTAENNWKITPEQFEENMTGRTKMIILNTPGNPTGSVYTADELRALGDVALYEDIIILADEIYEHLVYGDTKHTSIASPGKRPLRPNRHSKRIFQSLLHDRLARWLHRCAQAHRGSHFQDPGTHHLQRNHICTVWSTGRSRRRQRLYQGS